MIVITNLKMIDCRKIEHKYKMPISENLFSKKAK